MKSVETKNGSIFEGVSPEEIAFLDGVTFFGYDVKTEGSKITIQSKISKMDPTVFEVIETLPCTLR